MTIHTTGDPFVGRVSGRLLCYVAVNRASDVAVVEQAAAFTAAHPGSGLVVRGRYSRDLVRRWGAGHGGTAQVVVVDEGVWTSTVATADVPLALPAEDEPTLFPLTLDDWAASRLADGAHTVLTPAGFVPADDWPALKAVLVAGAQATNPRVVTLVATEAAMLDPARWPRFRDLVGEQHGGRALAFVFAAGSTWLASQRRMARLRELMDAFPGSLVVGAEVLAATDVLVHGGNAAIGLRSSQRQPRRPQDDGGPLAEGRKPGMFLRELWETRSPDVYQHWYANRPTPVCARCGRRPESFTADAADKDAVLVHNVHAWLDVLTDLQRHGEHARSWLAGERWWVHAAHHDLGPDGAGVPPDRLLAALCGLDGPPQQRQPAAAP